MSLSSSTSAARETDDRLAAPAVRELVPDVVQRWDAFVEACPQATFFHLAGWQQVIERACGHQTHYLYAESGGRITGVLPLAHIRSRLFGNALISISFCAYGGIAAEDEAAAAALETAACTLAARLKVDYLEMRNREPRRPDWPTKQLYVSFRKTLEPDPEMNLLAIPRKQRAMVRKGIEAGLRSEMDTELERFYSAYSQSYHNLGTPALSLAYFRLVKQVFKDRCDVLTVTRAGELVSSVMSFYFRNEVLPYYSGGTVQARTLKGNDFMYWELMRRSCERGLHIFDFGRSKSGTGSYSFKKNWGFDPQPLFYEYFLVKAGKIPDISPANPKYRFFINVWKRLPLPVTRKIGHLIARNVG